MTHSSVYEMPAKSWLLAYDRNVHTTRFVDAKEEEYSLDMVEDATPFTNEADALARLNDGNHQFCRLAVTPINDIYVYRADIYHQNMGDLRGFSLLKDEAEHYLRGMDEVDFAEGNFGQVTMFAVDPGLLDGVDLRDHATMLSEAIWGKGTIIEEFYYK